MNELNEARLALSAAQKLARSFPRGARPDLEQAEEVARLALLAALDKPRAAGRVASRLAPPKCCNLAHEVRDTMYAHETRCPLHGTKTKGTVD